MRYSTASTQAMRSKLEGIEETMLSSPNWSTLSPILQPDNFLSSTPRLQFACHRQGRKAIPNPTLCWYFYLFCSVELKLEGLETGVLSVVGRSFLEADEVFFRNYG